MSIPLAPCRNPSGALWGQWLQENRIELNEMTAPQFVAWLDGEMAKHAGGKVIPPEEVAVERYRMALEGAVRERETERILQDAGLDDVVDRALDGIAVPAGDELLRDVGDHFAVAPQERWVARVGALARDAARSDESLRPDQLTTENDG